MSANFETPLIQHDAALGAKGDVHEGVAAFLEKRAPQFPLSVSNDLPAMPWWPENPTGYR